MEAYNHEQTFQPQPWMGWVPQNRLGVMQGPCLSGPMDRGEQAGKQQIKYVMFCGSNEQTLIFRTTNASLKREILQI